MAARTTTDSHIVDCRGLQCPAPILRLAETVRKGRFPGGRLTILATDADFPVDLEAWCRTTKATLLRVGQDADDVIRAEVQLAGTPAAAAATAAAALELAPTLEDMGRVTPVSLERTSPSHGVAPARLPASPRTPGPPPAAEAAPRTVTAQKASAVTVASATAVTAQKAPVVTAQKAPSVTAQKAPVVTVASAPAIAAPPRENRATLLVVRNDLEALLAALMVANSSAAQGMTVEVYFAFWGIHLLRGASTRKASATDRPGLLQRMMLWLVPKGSRQRLGKLHLGGLGTRLLLHFMRKRNILALDQLVSAASSQGVRFRVCSMSMGLMGLQQSDIVDLPNIDFAGVTSFAEVAARSSVSLVF